MRSLNIPVLDAARMLAVFIIVIIVNELCVVYLHPRYVGLIWAVLFFWILIDSTVVCVDLAHAEESLKELRCQFLEMRTRNYILETENLKGVMEINERILMLDQRMKRLYDSTANSRGTRSGATLAGSSWSPVSRRHSDYHDDGAL